MDVGIVKWFGGYNAQRGKENDYGFIHSISHNIDIYVHKSEIQEENTTAFTEGKVVVYGIQQDKYNSERFRAKHVRFLEAIPQSQLSKLPINILQDSSVKDAILDIAPEIYLNVDPLSYFPYFSKENVRKLYHSNYKRGIFRLDNSVSLTQYFNTLPMYHKYRDENWWKDFDLSDASEESFCSMLLSARKKDISVDILYSLYTSKWLNCDAILSEISKRSSELFQWICCRIDDSFIYRFPKVVPYLFESRMKKLIDGINWKDTSDEYICTIKPVLQYVEADIQQNIATEIAIALFKLNLHFSKWWDVLQDSVKIRILIYCSNFPEKRYEWFENIGIVYKKEEKAGNKLITTVLNFLKIVYYNNKAQLEKQNLFIACHYSLMEYIADCYSKRVDITHATNTLLEKCYCYTPESSFYFCDARIWKSEDAIFCPEGINRAYSRHKCGYFKNSDLTRTRFQISHNYAHQYLADFIHNLGFTPNLSKLNIENPIEYAYRVSAHVNRLIDMRAHMKCSCGEWFHANFKYAKRVPAKLSATVFNCPKYSMENQSYAHDHDVYLNYCCCCQHVIDSRECKIRDEKNYYLCMKCGGAKRVKPGTQCPNCGTTEEKYLNYSGKYISCSKCGHGKRRNFCAIHQLK